LITEYQLVLVVEHHRETDTRAVDKRPVAAAQVDEGQIAAVLPLDQGVEAGNRTAVEQDGASIAAADGPGLAVAQRKAPAAGFQNQIWIRCGGDHVLPNVANTSARTSVVSRPRTGVKPEF
jgi:hypothetical protein